jgi:hypothetical protein
MHRFYTVNSFCVNCDEGFCIRGHDQKNNHMRLGCFEASMRNSGACRSTQPLCRCFYNDPKKHGIEMEWPKEVDEAMKFRK